VAPLAQPRGQQPRARTVPGPQHAHPGGGGLIPPLGGAAVATTIAGAITFDWSLGFNGLTYDELYRRSVAHRGMRVPARFSVVVGAALALLGAYGARRLIGLGRSPQAQSAICAGLAIVVVLDLQFDPRLQPYYGSIPSVYARVTPDMVLAEYPRDHDTDYMYFATRHQARLLWGYSGFAPNQPEVWAAFDALPTPAGVNALRKLGATHLTYNCRLERRERSCAWIAQQFDENPALELLASERWENADVRLYRLRP
jgi:hypothetical protein